MPDALGDNISVELELCEPPEEVQEYARTVLRENPDTVTQVLQELRDLIYSKGECTPHRVDDKFLLRFLRARYFNVESAHQLLANYCQFKENNPELFTNVNPMALRFIGDDDVLTVPPYRENTGRRIMQYRVGNWNPGKYSIDEVFKATLVTLELGILEPRAQILGGIAIFDFEGITLQHAWHVSPYVAKKCVDIMVTCFPMKIFAIHILNQSWVFDIIFTIFKPLLDDRMRRRIYFHGTDMESLHSHIHPKYLPEKYGGTREDYPYALWLESIKKNPELVKEMVSLGYIIDQETPNSTDKQDDV